MNTFTIRPGTAKNCDEMTVIDIDNGRKMIIVNDDSVSDCIMVLEAVGYKFIEE